MYLHISILYAFIVIKLKTLKSVLSHAIIIDKIQRTTSHMKLLSSQILYFFIDFRFYDDNMIKYLNVCIFKVIFPSLYIS